VLEDPEMHDTPLGYGYAPVNGLNLYYEIHGAGEPLILVHGGLGSAESFGANLAALATQRRVVAVELQGHGHTADVDRPLRFESMADDIAGLIAHLQLRATDVMGFSLGAGVALQVAIRHPELVRGVVAVSVPCRREGWYPEIRAAMAQMDQAAATAMKSSPLYARYARVAPRPQDWDSTFEKLRELLLREYDWSQQVAALANPLLLVFADAYSIGMAHIGEFFALRGGGLRDAGWNAQSRPHSRLAIVPDTTHYTIDSSPALPHAVLPFLSWIAATAA
jgi:pimeloyl-ACP methyl ester carboxylesterase